MVNSIPRYVGQAKSKEVAVPFSGKAQEIHDSIVSGGRVDYWVGVAKSYIQRKGQYQPGPPYSFDRNGLRARLIVELSGGESGATDKEWDEIADWLFQAASPL
jgi:hypothetical protein